MGRTYAPLPINVEKVVMLVWDCFCIDSERVTSDEQSRQMFHLSKELISACLNLPLSYEGWFNQWFRHLAKYVRVAKQCCGWFVLGLLMAKISMITHNSCARFKREQRWFHAVYKFCSVLNFKCLLFVITLYLSYLNRRSLSKLWLLTVYTYFFALIVYQSYAIAAYLISQKKHSPLFCSIHLHEYACNAKSRWKCHTSSYLHVS